MKITLAVLLFISINVSYANQQNFNVVKDRLLTDLELIDYLDKSFLNELLQKNDLTIDNTSKILQALGNHLKNRKEPVYFFGKDKIAERIKIHRERYPEYHKQILNKADRYIETYGADVDWLIPGKDKLGRPHTANTIRYIARQPFAMEIALSYYFSENSDYLQFQKDHLADFIEDYQNGKTQSGKNDVFERFYAGHRTRNLLFMYNLLLSSNELTLEDHIFMLKVFILHGAKLYESCKKFHWGNHQLHGLAGLYEMSIMYPEIPVMKFWNKEALRVIMEHISREIKADGFHFERASHYFKFEIVNYFRIYWISRLNGISLPPQYNERFNKMFDAIIALAKPTKKLPILQDAQDKYEATSNDIAELPDPTEAELMSIGSLVFNNPEYKYFAEKKFPAAFFWFFPQDTLDRFKHISINKPKLGSVSLDSSAYYVMRSGWEQNDSYLIIDGGLAKHKPDHSHGGVLGIIMHAFNEGLLPNYRVRYSDPSYRTLKNSLVKNVALVDGILQGQNWISNTSRTGFGIWQKLPKPFVSQWVSGSKYDFFKGTHNGFQEAGVDYSRSVFFIKPYCWFVIDEFKSERFHNYQQIWQGDYKIDNQYNRIFYQGPKVKLNIVQADPSYMDVTEKINFGKKSVEFKKSGLKDYSFLTLIYPDSVNSLVNPDIRLFERSNYKQVSIYAGDFQHSYYFNKGKILKLDELETDAENISLSYKSHSLASVFIYNGSQFTMDKLSFNSPEQCTVELEKSKNGEWSLNYLKGKTQEIIFNGKQKQVNNKW